jgi:hypothetical protein
MDLTALPGSPQELLLDLSWILVWASEMQRQVLLSPRLLSFRKNSRHESSDSSNIGSITRISLAPEEFTGGGS